MQSAADYAIRMLSLLNWPILLWEDYLLNLPCYRFFKLPDLEGAWLLIKVLKFYLRWRLLLVLTGCSSSGPFFLLFSRASCTYTPINQIETLLSVFLDHNIEDLSLIKIFSTAWFCIMSAAFIAWLWSTDVFYDLFSCLWPSNYPLDLIISNIVDIL